MKQLPLFLLPDCFSVCHESCVFFRNAAGLRGVDVVVLGSVFWTVLSRRPTPSHPLHPAETCQQRLAVSRDGGARRVHTTQLPGGSVMHKLLTLSQRRAQINLMPNAESLRQTAGEPETGRPSSSPHWKRTARILFIETLIMGAVIAVISLYFCIIAHYFANIDLWNR